MPAGGKMNPVPATLLLPPAWPRDAGMWSSAGRKCLPSWKRWLRRPEILILFGKSAFLLGKLAFLLEKGDFFSGGLALFFRKNAFLSEIPAHFSGKLAIFSTELAIFLEISAYFLGKGAFFFEEGGDFFPEGSGGGFSGTTQRRD